MIKLYVGAVWTKVFGMTEFDVKQFQERLAFRPTNYYFTPTYQAGEWDGWIRLFFEKGGNVYTYTGVVPRLLEMLKADNTEYELVVEYNYKNIEVMDTQLNGISMRDYQTDIVNVCKKKKRGVIKAPTGAGKTEMFIKLIADINVNVLVIVNRTTLFRQILEKITTRIGLRNSEINYLGDIKQYDPNNRITIATFQSLLTKDTDSGNIKEKSKWDEVMKKAQMVIVDEVHHLSMNELGNLLKATNKTLFRFGFSATPFREDGYDMMLEALIGPTIYDLSISKLIQEGFLAKPKIYFLKLPYTIATNETYATSYKMIQGHEKRNQTIAQIAFDFAKKDKLVLISFSKVEHLKSVYNVLEKINVDSNKNFVIKKIIGKNTAQQKTDALKKMNEKEFNIVLSTLFGEGVDIPNLDVLINARASKSEIDAYQQLGRVIRMVEGKQPIVIDFYDYNTVEVKKPNGKKAEDFFKGYAKSKIKLFQNEPEFEVHIIDNVDEIKELK